jgi:hypothetical protein
MCKRSKSSPEILLQSKKRRRGSCSSKLSGTMGHPRIVSLASYHHDPHLRHCVLALSLSCVHVSMNYVMLCVRSLLGICTSTQALREILCMRACVQLCAVHYACMRICMVCSFMQASHRCILVCMHAFAPASTYILIHAHMHIYMHACIRTQIYTCTAAHACIT